MVFFCWIHACLTYTKNRIWQHHCAFFLPFSMLFPPFKIMQIYFDLKPISLKSVLQWRIASHRGRQFSGRETVGRTCTNKRHNKSFIRFNHNIRREVNIISWIPRYPQLQRWPLQVSFPGSLYGAQRRQSNYRNPMTESQGEQQGGLEMQNNKKSHEGKTTQKYPCPGIWNKEKKNQNTHLKGTDKFSFRSVTC